MGTAIVHGLSCLCFNVVVLVPVCVSFFLLFLDLVYSVRDISGTPRKDGNEATKRRETTMQYEDKKLAAAAASPRALWR